MTTLWLILAPAGLVKEYSRMSRLGVKRDDRETCHRERATDSEKGGHATERGKRRGWHPDSSTPPSFSGGAVKLDTQLDQDTGSLTHENSSRSCRRPSSAEVKARSPRATRALAVGSVIPSSDATSSYGRSSTTRSRNACCWRLLKAPSSSATMLRSWARPARCSMSPRSSS
jgi:hypothetical protein